MSFGLSEKKLDWISSELLLELLTEPIIMIIMLLILLDDHPACMAISQQRISETSAASMMNSCWPSTWSLEVIIMTMTMIMIMMTMTMIMIMAVMMKSHRPGQESHGRVKKVMLIVWVANCHWQWCVMIIVKVVHPKHKSGLFVRHLKGSGLSSLIDG